MIKINIAELLASRKMKQSELAVATGICKSTISRYYKETVTRIETEHMDKLCQFFNCPVGEIFVHIQE